MGRKRHDDCIQCKVNGMNRTHDGKLTCDDCSSILLPPFHMVKVATSERDFDHVVSKCQFYKHLQRYHEKGGTKRMFPLKYLKLVEEVGISVSLHASGSFHGCVL